MNAIRADVLLRERGLAESRAQAQALMLAGKVRSPAGEIIAKPSRLLSPETELLVDSSRKFASRGGEKLEAFLKRFAVDVAGSHALDVGASTGGFTDCLLQRGAATVTCVDVGHGQLHPRLRRDSQVTNLEGLHAKDISKEKVGMRPFEIITVDVSFISLKKVLPHLWHFLAEGGVLIALIKPQFEAGKSVMDRCRGVIRDFPLQERLRDGLVDFSLEHLASSALIGVMDSPLPGACGNREFLMGLRKVSSLQTLFCNKNGKEKLPMHE